MRHHIRHHRRLLGMFAVIGGWCLAGCAPGGVFGEHKTVALNDAEAPAKADIVKTANKTKPKPSAEKDQGTFGQQLAKGRSLEISGRWDEAKIVYDKMIIDFPKRHEVYHRLGVVSDHRRHYTEAVEYYTKALHLRPNDGEILNDLGYCYFLQGQLSKAEATVIKAVAAAPANPRIRNNLGLIHGHQGKMDQALADFRKAGSEADAQYNLAFVLAAKDDLEGAKRCFEKAVAADPNFEKGRKALRSFERAENDPDALADCDDVSPQGTRFVPFVESDSGSSDGDQGRGQRSSAMAGNSSASSRNLQSRARSMLQDRLANTNSQQQDR